MDLKSTYLSQLCNENNMKNCSNFNLTFILHLFFFESISISAASLLGHPFFYDLTQKDSSAARQLYKEFIRPILFNENMDIIHMSENFRRLNSIHSLKSYNDLHNHAEFIENSKPDIIWGDESFIRISYLENMRKLIESINSHGLEFITRGSLDLFQKKLDMTLTEPLRCSNLYMFISENYKDLEYELKRLSDVVFHYSISSTLSPFSSAGFSSIFINRLKLVSSNHSYDYSHSEKTDYEEYSFEFPLVEISELHLMELLELRNLKPFKDIRKICREYRFNKKKFDSNKFQENIENFKDLLFQYCSNNKNNDRRKYVYNLIKSNNAKWKMKKIYTYGSAAMPFLLAFIQELHPMFKAALIFSTRVLGNQMSDYLSHQNKMANVAFPNENIEYYPLNGVFKGVID